VFLVIGVLLVVIDCWFLLTDVTQAIEIKP
jgi:hypothetical protein